MNMGEHLVLFIAFLLTSSLFFHYGHDQMDRAENVCVCECVKSQRKEEEKEKSKITSSKTTHTRSHTNQN